MTAHDQQRIAEIGERRKFAIIALTRGNPRDPAYQFLTKDVPYLLQALAAAEAKAANNVTCPECSGTGACGSCEGTGEIGELVGTASNTTIARAAQLLTTCKEIIDRSVFPNMCGEIDVWLRANGGTP